MPNQERNFKMNKSLSPLTALIFVASFVLSIIGAHIAYVMNANSQIAQVVANNPALEGKIRINYGNLPHMEYVIYGALIGLGIGTVLTVAFSVFGTKQKA